MANRREQVKRLNAIEGVKASWNADWNEFRVTLLGLSVTRQEDVAYYTSDYDDAVETAKAMVVRQRECPVT